MSDEHTPSDARARRAYQLVYELDHPSPEPRRRAADALVALGADAEPALTDALKVSALPVRRRVLMILQEIDAPRAIPDLMTHVLDTPAVSADDTRALAMRALLTSLRPRHRKHCFDFFTGLLRDPDMMVRVTAAEGLGKLADPRGRRFLEALIKRDDEPMVRDAARAVLDAFSPITLDDDPAAAPPPIHSRERLQHMLASRDATERQLAIDEACRRDEVDAHALFLDALRSGHALARQSGIIGLGEAREPRAARLLVDLACASNTDRDDRVLALRALARLELGGAGVDLGALQRQLQAWTRADDPFLAAAALSLLVHVAPDSATSVVLPFLEHREPWLRESAARALGRVLAPGDSVAARALSRALTASLERARHNPDAAEEVALQRALLQALHRIVTPGGADETQLLPVIVRLVAGSDGPLTALARDLMVRVARPPARLTPPMLQAVLDLLGAPDRATRLAALDVLEQAMPDDGGHVAARLASRLLFFARQARDEALLDRLLSLLARTRLPEARAYLTTIARDAAAPQQARARELLDAWPDGQTAAPASASDDARLVPAFPDQEGRDAGSLLPPFPAEHAGAARAPTSHGKHLVLYPLARQGDRPEDRTRALILESGYWVRGDRTLAADIAPYLTVLERDDLSTLLRKVEAERDLPADARDETRRLREWLWTLSERWIGYQLEQG